MEKWVIASVVVGILLVLTLELTLRKQRQRASRRQQYFWDETQTKIRERLTDPRREASLTFVRERQEGQQAFLDMICRSTAVALKSPRSVITLIDAESQTFIAHHVFEPDDRALPYFEERHVPLQSSYCQFTVAADHTLVINNAKRDPLVANNPCTVELGMRAYLGTPVYSKEGFPVGSLCVFDFETRRWSQRDIATIESFAALVSL